MTLTPFMNSARYLVRASHTEENWITPLKDAVQGVSTEEALWTPAEGVSSIAVIVAHSTPYLKGLINRLRGDEPVAAEDWPTVSGGDWERLRSELLAAIEELDGEVEKLGDQDLERNTGRGTPAWEGIADIAIHDAYHAGQIVKLQQLYRASKGQG